MPWNALIHGDRDASEHVPSSASVSKGRVLWNEGLDAVNSKSPASILETVTDALNDLRMTSASSHPACALRLPSASLKIQPGFRLRRCLRAFAFRGQLFRPRKGFERVRALW